MSLSERAFNGLAWWLRVDGGAEVTMEDQCIRGNPPRTIPTEGSPLICCLPLLSHYREPGPAEYDSSFLVVDTEHETKVEVRQRRTSQGLVSRSYSSAKLR